MSEHERPSPHNRILMYLHCGLCIKEWQAKAPGTEGTSPATYSQLEVGWTKVGLQVWCRRHECNVVHIDFEGQKHRANTDRSTEPDPEPLSPGGRG